MKMIVSGDYSLPQLAFNAVSTCKFVTAKNICATFIQ